jgi:phosphoglycolate phosphatase
MGFGSRVNRSRYVIWDWNGTLLNDMWLTLKVTNSLLADRGLSILDRGTYREVFGFPLVDYYRRIGLDLDQESFKELAREWNPLYETEREGCSLFSGIGNLVESLSLDGWGQCVVSAYEEKKLKELIGFHGICRFFSEIYGLDNDEGIGKVELGLKFVEKYCQKINLDTTIYVGDTVHDAEVARAMKIDCLLVSYGHQSRRRLEATGFDVVNNTEELFKKLQSWQKES